MGACNLVATLVDLIGKHLYFILARVQTQQLFLGCTSCLVSLVCSLALTLCPWKLSDRGA